MFDPTAFENMKTIIEGEIYDQDLGGRLEVIDRNDFINSSKLSRTYQITFSLKKQRNARITFTLEATLRNLSAELLEIKENAHLIGSVATINVFLSHLLDPSICTELQGMMERIWGDHLFITQKISYDPFSIDNVVSNRVTIDFKRLVTEAQMDDLLVMIGYMIQTLEQIQANDLFLPLK